MDRGGSAGHPCSTEGLASDPGANLGEAVKDISRNSERMAEPIVDIHVSQMTAALAHVLQMMENSANSTTTNS